MNLIRELSARAHRTGRVVRLCCSTDTMFRTIVLIKEALLGSKDYQKYNTHAREFRTRGEACHLLIFYSRNKTSGATTLVSSYIFINVASGAVEYQDNVIGEECYWSESEIMHHVRIFKSERSLVSEFDASGI